MTTSTLIPAGTAAATSKDSGFYINPGEEATVMCSPDLAGAEVVTIQISHDNGATWVDYQYNGATIQLTSTQNAVKLYGPMLYRTSKGVTAGSTGVFLIQGNKNAT